MPRLAIGFKTTPIDVDWHALDDVWAAAGEEAVFESGWMADHLTNATLDRGGSSYESVTLMAALAHHVPGKWLGHAVLSNSFRHPAVLAKQATVLDNVTGGRYILGLGAGWHEREHEAFGIPLLPISARMDRFESALRVLRALFSDEARSAPGVSLDDPFYPLRDATNEPGTVRPGGPPIWLGGQRRRGMALAARFGDGWLLPGANAGDVRYLEQKRDDLRRAFDEAGRDWSSFTIAGQVSCGATAESRTAARESALAMWRAGATHLILGLVPGFGSAGLIAAAREVAEPLAESAT
jgi:alkanesulfonate monooxygenase SsuD/methylene tetrahydromethanopterin reductase-like flavin-dependent oxidoreductase (luciferase family)